MSIKWIERLYNLQEVDLEIRTINNRLKLIPPEKEKIKNEAGKNIAKVNKQKEYIQSLELKIKQNELDINSQKELIKKLEQQSSMVRKNSEYEAMLHEIAELKADISKIEDNSLELIDLVASQQADLTKNIREMKQTNGQLKAEYTDFDNFEKELKKELALLQEKRNNRTQGIEPEILSRYEALLKRGSGKPFAKIIDGNCENCSLKITFSTLAEARKGQVVFCDNCQHYLFLEEHLPL